MGCGAGLTVVAALAASAVLYWIARGLFPSFCRDVAQVSGDVPALPFSVLLFFGIAFALWWDAFFIRKAGKIEQSKALKLGMTVISGTLLLVLLATGVFLYLWWGLYKFTHG